MPEIRPHAGRCVRARARRKPTVAARRAVMQRPTGTLSAPVLPAGMPLLSPTGPHLRITGRPSHSAHAPNHRVPQWDSTEERRTVGSSRTHALHWPTRARPIEKRQWSGRRPPVILLADPEPNSRLYLRQHLEDRGFCVVTAETGEDVILLCDISPPDVLILDVHMPDRDGFEVCEYVRHETRGAEPTIIIATEPTDEMTRNYLGPMVEFAGGDYFVAKPCDPHLLAQLIDDIVGCSETTGDGMTTAFPTRAVWPTSRGPWSPE